MNNSPRRVLCCSRLRRDRPTLRAPPLVAQGQCFEKTFTNTPERLTICIQDVCVYSTILIRIINVQVQNERKQHSSTDDNEVFLECIDGGEVISSYKTEPVLVCSHHFKGIATPTSVKSPSSTCSRKTPCA